jgi:hypothetical protein
MTAWTDGRDPARDPEPSDAAGRRVWRSRRRLLAAEARVEEAKKRLAAAKSEAALARRAADTAEAGAAAARQRPAQRAHNRQLAVIAASGVRGADELTEAGLRQRLQGVGAETADVDAIVADAEVRGPLYAEVARLAELDRRHRQ